MKNDRITNNKKHCGLRKIGKTPPQITDNNTGALRRINPSRIIRLVSFHCVPLRVNFSNTQPHGCISERTVPCPLRPAPLLFFIAHCSLLFVICSLLLVYLSCSIAGDLDQYKRQSNQGVCTVVFNANGGSEVPSQSLKTGDKIELVSTAKTGHSLDGWYRESAFLSKWDFEADTVSADITLYAKWDENPSGTFIVAFNANGGTAISSQFVKQGGTVMPVSAAKTGHTLEGWYKDEDFSNRWDFDTDTVSSDITLYAKWNENPTGMFTVTFFSNGGSPVAFQLVDRGDYVNIPVNPARAGYAFDNWYADAVHAVPFNFDVPVNADRTAYAKWNAYALTIHYEGGEGIGSAPAIPADAAYGSSITMPANTYARSGYNFAGWEVSGAGAIPGLYAAGAEAAVADLSTAIAGGNTVIILTAVWTYTVTFDINNAEGTAPDPQTAAAGSAITTPGGDSFSRTGYTFNCWNTNSSGTGISYGAGSAITFNGNAVLYATWTNIIENIGQLSAYLSSFASNTANNPVPVKVKVNLDNDWQALLSALTEADRYVELDLSGSSGMEIFNPGTTDTGKNRIVKLILPDVSTATGDDFWDFFSLREISGAAISVIGDYSFTNIPSLKIIDFPVLISIGSYAFKGCTGLSSITIPDSVTSIGSYAFQGCTGLTSITIPDSVTSIGQWAFAYCTGLSSIAITNSVTSIGNFAFIDCTGLYSITIPDSVTSIGSGAFRGCTGLYSITIPVSVTSIVDEAFYGCTGLASITIPDSVTSIGYRAFEGCTGLASITIPDSVTSIGYRAFEGCTGLASVTIPDSVTSIGSYAFSGCNGLSSITIPDSVTIIGSYAFSGCTGITSVIIGNGVASLGNYISAFSSCYNLQNIFADTGNLHYSSIDGVLYDKNLNSIIMFPKGRTSVTIPDSVTSIGDYAFQNCNGLSSITIPDSVTSIGSSAFFGCNGLSSITIPDSVTIIGSYAFSGCTGLASVTIPDSVTSIGSSAFQSCYRLTSITIPGSVTSIGSLAFQSCTGLSSITFEGLIDAANFSVSNTFPGDLREKYLAAGGGIGTYTTTNPGNSAVWEKQ